MTALDAWDDDGWRENGISRLLVHRHSGGGKNGLTRRRAAMGQDTLNEVLEVEKQLKSMLDAETEKARRWLEQTKREIEQAKQSEIAELSKSIAGSKVAAREAAETEAAGIARRASALRERIERLDDDQLQKIAWEHIVNIVPGVARDR